MPGVKTGTTVTKRKIPKVVHPLATPGYIIILKFIAMCILNMLIFAVTYSFLAIAVPTALVLKIVQNLAVYVRLKSQNVRADSASASESFWFFTARADQNPSIILLLAVKGRVTAEHVEYLVQNRLCGATEEQNGDNEPFERLHRSPKRIFRQLVWVMNDEQCSKIVYQYDIDSPCLLNSAEKSVNLQHFGSSLDWQAYLYTANGNVAVDNAVIVLRFRHCIVDVHTLLYAISNSFLDRQVFSFREEISPAQGFCLSLMAFLAGPSVFVKNLLKSNDTTFDDTSLSFAFPSERAVFYSDLVSRNDVEIVTAATGTSVCDVILSCLAGSLRSCFKQNGVQFPDDVTVYYPMNIESSKSLRCYTSSNIFSLPVGTEGALPRLWEMRLRRNSVSSFVEAITSITVMQLAFLILPVSLATRLMEFFMNKSSCTVTCVLNRMSDEDILLDDMSVEHFIPIEDRGRGISITIIESKEAFQLAVLAPTSPDFVIKPSHLCAEFVRHVRVLSARFTERARVVHARGQKVLNSRRNSVFVVEEDEQ